MAEPASTLLAAVAAGVTFPMLLLAGAHHLLRPRRLAGAVRARGWPAAVARPAAVALAVAEVGLGAAGTAGLITGPRTALIPAGAAMLLVAYALDTARVVRSGARVPCGCGAADHPVNVWVAVRAAAYACLAALATWQGAALLALGAAPALTAITAAAAIGLLLWLLPRALAIPPGIRL